MMYKGYGVEGEVARMIEEEKALKQLRRTMVPHARPLPKFDHPFYPHKKKRNSLAVFHSFFGRNPQLMCMRCPSLPKKQQNPSHRIHAFSKEKKGRKMMSTLTVATFSAATFMR